MSNATFGGGYATVTFMDESAMDFHLAPDDTAARDQGVNLSNDANLAFLDDIDVDSRPQGVGWDIGADETSFGEG